MSNDESALLSLPTELLLEVASYLPDSSFLVLRNVSRRFNRTFELYKTPVVSRDERLAFLRMMDSHFQKTCFEAFCEKCQELHPAEAFWPGDLAKPVLGRRCKGADGALRTFNYTLGFNDISKNHTKWSYRNDGQGEFSIRKLKSEDFIINECVGLLPLLERRGFPRRDHIAAVLEGIDMPICPHVKFSDPRLSKYYARPSKLRRFFQAFAWAWDTHRKSGFFCPGLSRFACPVKHCNTTIEFVWFESSRGAHDPYGCVELKTQRNLGKMNSAWHLQWLSQLTEPPEPDLEDYWVQCKAWKRRVFDGYLSLKHIPHALKADRSVDWRTGKRVSESLDTMDQEEIAATTGPWHLALPHSEVRQSCPELVPASHRRLFGCKAFKLREKILQLLLRLREVR